MRGWTGKWLNMKWSSKLKLFRKHQYFYFSLSNSVWSKHTYPNISRGLIGFYVGLSKVVASTHITQIMFDMIDL